MPHTLLYRHPNLKQLSKDDGDLRKKRYLQRPRSSSEPAQFRKLQGYKFNKPSVPINGFFTIVISNYAFYEGLFQNGQRFGPGVLTYVKSMSQNVGWWKSDQLLRLCRIVESQWVPTIKSSKKRICSKDYNIMGDNKTNNVEAVIKIVGTGVYSSQNEAQLDLEQMLQSESANILVKRCKTRETPNFDLNIFKDFQNRAYNEVLLDIIEYTLSNIGYRTTYKINNLISNERYEFGSCGLNERACMDFLAGCSNGDEVSVKTLRDIFNIHPDLCDGDGNFGLVYAAARDRLNIIPYLSELGANFNLTNDDGLTPLSLVLCRFIALLRNITNWGSAFSYTSGTSGYASEECNNDPNLMPFIDITFFYHNKSLDYDKERIQLDIPNLYTYYGLHLPVPTLQKFQGPYSTNGLPEYNDQFIFDFRLQPPSSHAKKKPKSTSREISNETLLRLTVIFNTMMVLLNYGCDPLFGTVPMPPLFLGLFTENTDIIRILLKYGANPLARLTWYHNITVMHALVSMRSGHYLVDICKLLLSTKFDLDARTDGNHWWRERSWVIGNAKEVFDTGKTALHILAMRKDFHSDSCLKQLAEQLIVNGSSCSKRYLGHVPLTLAMLRGNVNFVKTLLKLGASPNETLGGKMGSPLNLFLLVRYKDQLPKCDTCLDIMELLFKYGGDPLKRVSSTSNTLEFLKTDQCRSVHRNTKRHSFKHIFITKLIVTYTEAQKKIQLVLLNNARDRLIRHYECLMFMALFIALKKDIKTLADVGFHLKLVQLMKLEHSLQIARHFMYINVLNPNVESDYNALSNMLAFIKQYGAPTQYKSNKALTKAINKLTPLAPTGPELDLDFKKYSVCFSCCLRHGKILLSCPSCGLVHFCSRRCEIRSKKAKLHPCKVTFYSDELLQYKFCLALKIHYEGIHDKFFDNIRKILLNINHQI